ncbi:MDH2 [Mytilus edulis]|uniref:malate dehydrogenase n=1 Tax=Mytilus edulis TaxID=6550 RepID=A0A8S3QA13_MYTED|nr:MDH2 [Mytilus edulis]
MRLAPFVMGCNVTKLVVPVVGGNSGITIVPLISQSIPPVDLSQVSTSNVTKLVVPVVGGNSGITIVPLISQSIPPVDLSQVSTSNVTKLVVPVVGGNSGITIVPLISQSIPPVDLSQEERKKIIQKLQNADTEIIETKASTGSATLSMAHAASKFTLSLLAAIDGEEGQVESAYVKSEETTSPYLATPLLLGGEGIVKNLGMSSLDEFETEMVKAALPELTRNIQKGIDYANKS